MSCSPLTVVDLDGTYVRANTLHIYIKCGLRQMLVRRCFSRLFYSLGLIFARCLRLVSHRTMKFGICRMIDATDEKLREVFAAKIRMLINDDIVKRIAKAPRVLLATAAPETYVSWIWDGDFVATAMFDNPQAVECRGEEKLRRVSEYAKNSEYAELYTDHEDDLPLMHKFQRTILVNPSEKTIEVLEKSVLKNFEILRNT